MNENVDLVLEYLGEKIGVAIPPAPDLTPYEKTVVVDRKLTDLLGTEKPKSSGDAAPGTATKVTREDHIHPLQKDVVGNAGTATKLASSRTITLSGAVSGSGSFDGSGNLAIATTSNIVGLQLGNAVGSSPGTAAAGTSSTAARSDHVHPVQTSVTGNAETASRLATSRTITISGAVSGSASFDGSSNITISTTGDENVSLGNAAGASPTSGGSSGSASTASRSDHTHPLQTTISGNAGTASRLATSRTITISGAVSGSASFDGSNNITISTSGGSSISLSSSTPVNDSSSASAGSASTAARGDHRHQYPDTVLNSYTSGGNILFWSGPESALPSSRNNNTIYFVY